MPGGISGARSRRAKTLIDIIAKARRLWCASEEEAILESIKVIWDFLGSKPRGIAQSGSASALGAEGRWFKSSYPDH